MLSSVLFFLLIPFIIFALFLATFSLPRRISEISLTRLFSALPTTVCAFFVFIAEKSSALSSLVDSRRTCFGPCYAVLVLPTYVLALIIKTSSLI